MAHDMTPGIGCTAVAGSLAALLLAGSSAVQAEVLQLICENPRREYVVRFDDQLNTLFADDTAYRVLAVERSADRFVVVGLTVGDGPTFRAHFHPYKKMELFAGDQLVQTDGCR